MTENTMIPDGFQALYNSWHTQYIKEDKKWARSVNNNPFIAIETHINEDTITDLLAHILQTNKAIKKQFITFLLNKAKDNEKIESINKITDKDKENTEIETQYFFKDKGKKSFIDLLIKIPHNYYIIIESKIFDAEEQQNQMERYIDGIKSLYKAQDKNIIAFYATVDGTEECRTAGKYKKRISKLAFYKEDEPTSIYSFLNNNRDNKLVNDFLDYLEYKFSSPTTAKFFEKNRKRLKSDLKTQLDKVYVPDSQSIQKRVNEYDSPKEFFYQLLKVHILNQYIINLFNPDKNKINYSYVFSGIKLKKEIENYSVCFETKYWYNSYYIVITLCSKKRINKKDLFKEVSRYVETKRNKTTGEYEYSLWLWVFDFDVFKKYKEKNEDNNIRDCKSYSDYIDLICKDCMKPIFENISKDEKQNITVPYNIYNKLSY